MPSKDERTARANNRRKRGIVISGTGPREMPLKRWPSNKPPGGKRLEPPAPPDKQS